MGRRSDHSRAELRELIVAEGHRQMEQVGFAHFSAREVAKRIGYSIGTLYNVFGSYDRLILAINGRTLELWLDYLQARLEEVDGDRLQAAIGAYFEFAVIHRHTWAALYDFRLPDNQEPGEDYEARVHAIIAVVEREVRDALSPARADKAPGLTRSLLACVHGHCFFTLNGTFRMLGETDPLSAARARIQEAIEAVR